MIDMHSAFHPRLSETDGGMDGAGPSSRTIFKPAPADQKLGLFGRLSLDFDLADVWWHPESIVHLGRTVPVQSATDTMWFLAARLYHETYQMNTPRLSMLGDLATILDKAADRIDWARLVAVTHKYGMQPGVFYVLGQLRNLFGGPVPEDVLTELSPSRSSSPSSHDWGDLLPKLSRRSVLVEVVLP